VLNAMADMVKIAEIQGDFYRKAGLKVNRWNYFTQKPNPASVSELISFDGLQKFIKEDAP